MTSHVVALRTFKDAMSFFLGLTDGWTATILNTQNEADFIGQTARSSSGGSLSFVIGGSTTGPSVGETNFIQYRTGNSGNLLND